MAVGAKNLKVRADIVKSIPVYVIYLEWYLAGNRVHFRPTAL